MGGAGETQDITTRMKTGCGYLDVTVKHDSRGLCEVFAVLEKAGGCATAQLEALSRLVSMLLRAGIKPETIIKQLRGVKCHSIVWEEGRPILSCADAIAIVLEQQIGQE